MGRSMNNFMEAAIEEAQQELKKLVSPKLLLEKIKYLQGKRSHCLIVELNLMPSKISPVCR